MGFVQLHPMVKTLSLVKILRTGAGNIYVSNLDPNIDNKVGNWSLLGTKV